jgi:hypothetical protein
VSKLRYTTYELKFAALTEDGAEVINWLQPRLSASFATIAEANAKRRAIRELFGEAVQMDIMSVRRIPARTRRRVLRIR